MDAEELLRRYAARERDFSGVRLRGVFLDRAEGLFEFQKKDSRTRILQPF